MTKHSIEEALDAFTRLTDTLQDCLKSQDIQRAMILAEERHDKLINLFEGSEVDQSVKMQCAKTTLDQLRAEHRLTKSKVKQDRAAFVARKAAYHAYTSKAFQIGGAVF
jgi:hypothetical protein